MSDYHYSKQLCHSFYQVNKLFNQFYMKNLTEFDLTYTQYLVLLVLWEKAPLTLKELGKKLDLASNTLTPLLKRLEEKGYIQRLVPTSAHRTINRKRAGLASYFRRKTPLQFPTIKWTNARKKTSLRQTQSGIDCQLTRLFEILVSHNPTKTPSIYGKILGVLQFSKRS